MTGSSTLAVYGSLRRFMPEASGATAIEYALIAAGISIVIVGTVTAVGANVTDMFTSVATALR